MGNLVVCCSKLVSPSSVYVQWILLKMSWFTKFSHLRSQTNLVPKFLHVINICVVLLVCVPLKRIWCLRNKNFTMQQIFQQFNTFSDQNHEQFPIHSICYQHTVVKMLSVCKDSSPWPCLPQVRSIDKQFSVNPWKRVARNYITLWLLFHLFPHMHFTKCDMSWAI